MQNDRLKQLKINAKLMIVMTNNIPIDADVSSPARESTRSTAHLRCETITSRLPLRVASLRTTLGTANKLLVTGAECR